MIANQHRNSGNSETIVLYPSRSRFFLIALGSLLFVCGGFYIGSLHGDGIPRATIIPISLLAIGFFGLCFLYASYRLVVRRPAVTLSPEGIVDNASAISAGLVRWEEIERIYCSSLQGQLFISIAVKNPEVFLQRSHGAKTKLMQLNMGLVGAPVNLPVTGLDLNATALLKLIQEFREARSR
jgi:hypothetical protein